MRGRVKAAGTSLAATIRASRPFVLGLLTLLALLAFMASAPIRSLDAANQRVEYLHATKQQLTASVTDLEHRKTRLQDPEQVELLARSKFGLVKPGETAYVVVDVSSYATKPVTDALSMVRPGGTVVLAGVKGFKPVDGFVSDLIVMKEINVRGAIGVTSSGYRNAIRLIESGRVPIARMHTHDFALADAELAIRTLARQVAGDESIHSCLIPPA
jgi:threonine dehydrogenase-like Zn-dependent dehydrogenase